MKSPLFICLFAGLAAIFTAEASPLKNPAPPKNRVVPCSPGPITLQATRVEMDEIDKKLPTFTFSLKNAQSNSGFVLVAKNIDGVEEVLHSSLNRSSDGQLLDGVELFKLCTLAMGPGEPITIKVASKNGMESAELQFIPRPLQINENGYALSLQLGDPENKTFYMQARGFTPFEKVQLFTFSGDIKINKTVIADKNGMINSTLLHKTYEHLGGTAYLELKGVNGTTCLTYPWGCNYQRELRGIKKIERSLVRADS